MNKHKTLFNRAWILIILIIIIMHNIDCWIYDF